jgi:hypothetical protein
MMPYCDHGVAIWDDCVPCDERLRAEDPTSIDEWEETFEDVKRTTNVLVDKRMLPPWRRIEDDSFEMAVLDWRLGVQSWWERHRGNNDLGGEG